MLRVFNCGIGMVVVVAAEHAQAAGELLRAAGESVWHIGAVQTRSGNEAQTVVT